jgi:hypothetical protein
MRLLGIGIRNEDNVNADAIRGAGGSQGKVGVLLVVSRFRCIRVSSGYNGKPTEVTPVRVTRDVPAEPCGDVAMELREHENHLEVVLLEKSPLGNPTLGDCHFAMRVLSGKFAGASESAWVDADSLNCFLHNLSQLEQSRQGVARLEALGSPDECWLEFRAIDRAGHMAVFGRVSSCQFLSTGHENRQAIEFGFEFCPSRLPVILAAFRSYAG